MNYFEDIADKLAEIRAQVYAATTPQDPPSAGLDRRCGQILVGEDYIASANPKMIDYYGGFEYVDSDYVLDLGDMKIYSIEDERVASHMATLEHNCD